MKIEIDYKKITDSPYRKDENSFFSFTDTEVAEFVSLISKMNESSYYVSGYRGVGKTSFISKVEEELSKLNGYIFIHVPIAKYDKYEILIRSFIRQFYCQFVENKLCEKDEKIKINEELPKLVAELSQLNKETFAIVNKEIVRGEKFEKVKEIIKLNLKEEILFFALSLLTVFLLTINFGSQETYKIIAQILSVGVTIAQAIKLGYTLKETTTFIDQNTETHKTFYDDDIAEYRFNSLLKKFKAANIRPVFVLDELDKLSVKDSKNVLFLFKSTFLAGHANFIVVGGQELYYDLYTSHDIEDPILSTLFSKTFHVPLKSSYELRNLFNSLVLNKNILQTEEQKAAYYQYINCGAHSLI